MIGGGGSISETTGKGGPIKSTLDEGLDLLDQEQTVTFNLYRRLVLPLDGFVFWVRGNIIQPGVLPAGEYPETLTFSAQGYLHHTTTNRQDPDESYSTNRMIFTSKTKINDLADMAPETMYLASTNGMRYTFSSRSMYSRQADLYHYAGDAVYPTMATQIIETAQDLNLRDVVVSNSLPIWLRMNQLFPVFPSFLVPDNIEPPYAVININEDDTTPLQAGTVVDATGSRYQLAKDTVKVVTYGVRNNTILDWIEMVKDRALEPDALMGVMNSPIPRDDKRGQTEISALAQKKVTSFDVNYYQARVMQSSRQYITSVFIDFVAPEVHA